MAKKKGKMTKRPSILVNAPGCESCGKVCKYNTAIADPFMASEWKREAVYGCNSRLTNFGLEEACNGRKQD
jgi:hypothetical protein